MIIIGIKCFLVTVREDLCCSLLVSEDTSTRLSSKHGCIWVLHYGEQQLPTQSMLSVVCPDVPHILPNCAPWYITATSCMQRGTAFLRFCINHLLSASQSPVISRSVLKHVPWFHYPV